MTDEINKKEINTTKIFPKEKNKTITSPLLIFLGMLVKVKDEYYIGLFKQPGIIEPFFKLDIEDSPNINDYRIVVVQVNVHKTNNDKVAGLQVKEHVALEVNKSISDAYEKGKLESLCNHVYLDVISHIVANQCDMEPAFIELLKKARYI